MCLFALPVREVASTNIFASMQPHAPGLLRQTLIYEARVETVEPNAMVLPIPVHPHVGAAGITLLDISAFPELFRELIELFRPPPGLSPPAAPASALPVLPVHRVGSFNVSIVPTLGDFHRLSGIFSLAFRTLEAVLRARYADHAFVVYQFVPGSAVLHPFGLSFVTRYASLYFPTLHVHDGTSPAYAAFDHQLYAQRSLLPQRSVPPARNMKWMTQLLPKTPFIDGNDAIETGVLCGVMVNQDTFIENDPRWLRTLNGPLHCIPPPATVPPAIVSYADAPLKSGPTAPRVHCSSCGWISREGALFCSQCGRPIQRPAARAATPPAGALTPCSKCGWMLSAGAASCAMCGQPTPAGSLNTPPATREKPDHEMIKIVIGVTAFVVFLILRFFMGWL